MADNMIFKDDEKTRRVHEVGSKVAPGTPVVTPEGAGVTLTGSGDNAVLGETVLPDGEIVEYVARRRGGVGLEDEEATVAFSGTFAFVFDGSDLLEGGEVILIDDSGDLVVEAEGVTGERLGIVEFVRPEDGAAAVKIGV